jgi:hypothetical protein
MKSKVICAAVLALSLLTSAATLGAQTGAKAATGKTSSTATVQKPPQPGMVWANTKSKVYHKDGDQWYGKGKNGKWMTEADAKKGGYRASSAGAVGAPASTGKKSQ